MDFQTWLAFVAASTVLVLIPGPTVILVLSYALSQGRTVALATVAGVALGDLIAMTASLVGLGALVLTSATLFVTLKWIGAIYLIWLGIKLLRSNPQHGLQTTTTRATSAREIFRHATIVTALNPKSIAFFIAFVPQFISVQAPIGPQFTILILTFVAIASINALAYALLADGLRAKIGNARVVRWLNRAGGSALIAMGIMTASLRRAA